MEVPKVSVIIPVYNSEDLLGECLESVKGQSLEDIEIICVDDGSSDSSFDILNEFASSDSRFKVYRQENAGAGAARNRGISEACGDFILFVDSDDYIEREGCEKLYEQASRLDCDVVLFDSMRHFPDNRDLKLVHFRKNDDINYAIRVFDHEYFRDRIFDGEYGVIWNKMYKASFIRDNEILFPGHKIYNDVEFHVKTTLLAKKISYVDGIFYHYNRQGHSSLQTSFVKTEKAMVFFDVLHGLVDFLVENDFFEEFREEFVNFTIFELRNKLNSIAYESKEEFFERTKEFYYFLDLTSDEVNSIPFEYFMHFIFVVNSSDYSDFIKKE